MSLDERARSARDALTAPAARPPSAGSLRDRAAKRSVRRRATGGLAVVLVVMGVAIASPWSSDPVDPIISAGDPAGPGLPSNPSTTGRPAAPGIPLDTAPISAEGLAAARAAWATSGITAYRWTVLVTAASDGPSLTRRNVDTSGVQTEELSSNRVEDLFIRIDESLRSGSPISGRFDPTYGYPRELRFEFPSTSTPWTMITTGDLVILASPASTEPTDADSGLPVVTDLSAAQGLWKSSGPADYRWTLVSECFCVVTGTPFDVDVTAGVASLVGATDGGTPLDPEAYSVDGLFSSAADTVAAGRVVIGEFDPIDGHPFHLEIDLAGAATDSGVAWTSFWWK